MCSMEVLVAALRYFTNNVFQWDGSSKAMLHSYKPGQVLPARQLVCMQRTYWLVVVFSVMFTNNHGWREHNTYKQAQLASLMYIPAFHQPYLNWSKYCIETATTQQMYFIRLWQHKTIIATLTGQITSPLPPPPSPPKKKTHTRTYTHKTT